MGEGSEHLRSLYHLPGFHEPFSAISHLLGALVFAYLSVFLLRRGRGDAVRLFYLGVFCFSGVLLLSLSAVNHMLVRDGDAQRILRRLDHGAIFVLIAGTFTPAHGLLFRGALRWGPLIAIWAGAIAGVTLKSMYFDDMPEWLGLACYLTMGWVGALSGCLLWLRFGFAFIKPVLIGGLAYSIGALLDYARAPILVPGVLHAHELFHVMVLVGVLCHFVFVWRIATVSPR
jgi:channel protein (hemolysin III family)